MKHILCFGDSNTYGCAPEDWSRYPPEQRWTGILQAVLGADFRVIEEGLGGRTTVFEDPTSPGRCGKDYLFPCMQSHDPLDAVVIMLGTNDCKGFFSNSTYDIAAGMALLGQMVLNPMNWRRDGIPKLLIVAPAPLGEGLADHPIFSEHFGPQAAARSHALAGHYQRVAAELGAAFFNAGDICSVSPADSVHLDRQAHRALGRALAQRLRMLLAE